MYYEEDDSHSLIDDLGTIHLISRVGTATLPMAFACVVLAVALGGIWSQIAALAGLTLIGVGWIASCLTTRLFSMMSTAEFGESDES
jgi:hypothetical protein